MFLRIAEAPVTFNAFGSEAYHLKSDGKFATNSIFKLLSLQIKNSLSFNNFNGGLTKIDKALYDPTQLPSIEVGNKL